MDNSRFERLRGDFEDRLARGNPPLLGKRGRFANLSYGQRETLKNMVQRTPNLGPRQKRTFLTSFDARVSADQIGSFTDPTRAVKRQRVINSVSANNLDKMFPGNYFENESRRLQNLREQLSILRDPASEYLSVDVEKAERILAELKTIYTALSVHSVNPNRNIPAVYKTQYNNSTSKVVITPKEWMIRKTSTLQTQYRNLIQLVQNTLQSVKGNSNNSVSREILRRRSQLKDSERGQLYQSVILALLSFTDPKKFRLYNFRLHSNRHRAAVLTKPQLQLVIDTLIRERVVDVVSFTHFMNSLRAPQSDSKVWKVCCAFEIAYIGLYTSTTLPVAPFRTDASSGAGDHCPSLQSVVNFTRQTIANTAGLSGLFGALLRGVHSRFSQSTGASLRQSRLDFFIPRRFVVPLKYVDGLTSNLYASTEHGFAHRARVVDGVNQRAGVPANVLNSVTKLKQYVRGNIEAARVSVIKPAFFEYMRTRGVSLFDITDFSSVNAKAVHLIWDAQNKLRGTVEINKANALAYDQGYPWMVIVLKLTQIQEDGFTRSQKDLFIYNGAFDLVKYALHNAGTDTGHNRFHALQLTPQNMNFVYSAYGLV